MVLLATSLEIQPLQALSVLLGAAVLAFIRLALLRSQQAKGQADADETKAKAELVTAEKKLVDQDYYQELIGDLTDRIENLKKDYDQEFSTMRDRVRDAQANAAEARAEAAAARSEAAQARSSEMAAHAELAQTQAALARTIAEAGTERHNHNNELTARDAKIAVLERELRQVKEELATLRARMGDEERRGAQRRDTET